IGRSRRIPAERCPGGWRRVCGRPTAASRCRPAPCGSPEPRGAPPPAGGRPLVRWSRRGGRAPNHPRRSWLSSPRAQLLRPEKVAVWLSLWWGLSWDNDLEPLARRERGHCVSYCKRSGVAVGGGTAAGVVDAACGVGAGGCVVGRSGVLRPVRTVLRPAGWASVDADGDLSAV